MLYLGENLDAVALFARARLDAEAAYERAKKCFDEGDGASYVYAYGQSCGSLGAAWGALTVASYNSEEWTASTSHAHSMVLLSQRLTDLHDRAMMDGHRVRMFAHDLHRRYMEGR